MKINLNGVQVDSKASPFVHIPDSSPALYALPDLKGVVYVRAAEGTRETFFRIDDVATSSSSGEAVVPTWSSAERVIVSYGLEALVVRATEIMHELFGDEARIAPEILKSPDSLTPTLVIRLHVPRNLRHLRAAYLARYSAETEVPTDAPAPALLWTYRDAAVSA